MHKSGVEPLVLNWNRLAMENLREDKYPEALKLLQKAEELLKYPDGTDPSKLLAITYNNLGCYYRRCQKYQTSLEYLTRALDIEISSVTDKTNIAGTHLNICSVYSSMKLHEKALTHGIQAIKYLKEAYEIDKSTSNLISLIIALNNTGYEYEMLKEKDNALNTYKCGMDLAYKQLGPDHQISQALFKSYSNLLSNLAFKSSKKFKITKRKSEGLPNIKALNIRNRSHGSRTRVHSGNDISGTRTNSNKKFSDNRVLPVIEKPRTVAKRQKRVLKDDKVQGLEEKIAELQNQISVVQQKYRNLEAQVSRKMTKNQAAVVIQRKWREFIKGKQKSSTNKALVALRELEVLKKQIPREVKRPLFPLTVKYKDSFDVFSPKPNNSRLYKHIKIPLDPIRESKLETKEMKATLIQSYVRKFLARKKYLKMKQSAVKVQRWFRAIQCKKLFWSICQAIIYIQRFWRKRCKNKINKN